MFSSVAIHGGHANIVELLLDCVARVNFYAEAIFSA